MKYFNNNYNTNQKKNKNNLIEQMTKETETQTIILSSMLFTRYERNQ